MKLDRLEPLYNKKLASLGDAIVNFLASASLTLARTRPVGVKVSDRVLDKVFRKSCLSGIGLPRGYRGADIVEAFFGYMWLKGLLNLEHSIDFLAEEIRGGSSLEEAFSRLIDELLAC